MKFTVIFAFVVVVLACFMLPMTEANAVRSDEPDAGPFGLGADLASGFIKTLGQGMSSMMSAGNGVARTALKTGADGMKEFNKDISSFVSNGKDTSSKSDKKE